MNGIANQCGFKPCYNKMTSEVGCFWFPLVTMSAHTHAYRYCLFESGMKTGL